MEKDDIKLLEEIRNTFQNLSNELEKKIIGQKEIINYLFIILLARGHGLMIGVPGLAKTLLIKSSRFLAPFFSNKKLKFVSLIFLLNKDSNNPLKKFIFTIKLINFLVMID